MGITRSKTVAMVSDIHIPHHMPAEWQAFRLWHADARPTVTIINGDFLDLEQLSTFDKDPSSSIRVIPEIQAFVREANALAAECGTLHIIEGNHEARWGKAMKDLAGRLYGAVGLTLREQCRAQGLDASVQWHIEDQHWRGMEVGQMTIRHGHLDAGRFGGGEHIAASLLKKTLGRSITVGHHHTVQMIVTRNDRGELVQASCNGTFEKPAGFAPNNKWVYGFHIYEKCDPDWCTVHPIVIEKGRFGYGGKVYNGNGYETAYTDTDNDVHLPSKPPYPAYFASVEERIDAYEKDVKSFARPEGDSFLPPPPIVPREVRDTATGRRNLIPHPVTGVVKSVTDWAIHTGQARTTLNSKLARTKVDPSYTLEMALSPVDPE